MKNMYKTDSKVEIQRFGSARVGLAWFYGISTIVGYLMPNLFLYTYQIYDFSINFVDNIFK